MTPTLSSAAASGGAAGAVVVIAVWGLSLAHLAVPAEVAAALQVLAAVAIHSVAMGVVGPKLDLAPTAPTAAPAAPPVSVSVKPA